MSDEDHFDHVEIEFKTEIVRGPEPETKPKSRRGFAAMSLEKRTEISRKGGLAMPNEGRAFSKDRELAARAGRKGGENSRGGGRKSNV